MKYSNLYKVRSSFLSYRKERWVVSSARKVEKETGNFCDRDGWTQETERMVQS